MKCRYHPPMQSAKPDDIKFGKLAADIRDAKLTFTELGWLGRLIGQLRREKAVSEDEDTELTCDYCEAAPICFCAFDTYNTDGDCLARK